MVINLTISITFYKNIHMKKNDLPVTNDGY